MAETPQTLAEATKQGEIAPSSLAGWGALQRQVNVRVPYLCQTAIHLARDAVATLGGKQR